MQLCALSNWKSQIVMSNDNLNLKSQFATLEKWDSLRSRFATIEGRCGQHRKYLMVIDEIQNRIYTIRGVQVMLDSDLAEFGYRGG